MKCDVLLVPCGGTYTMDYKEAAEFTGYLNPKYVIPTHYGDPVGEKACGSACAKEIATRGIDSVVVVKL